MQTFTGLQYLMIDVAGSFGHDKETWDFRLDWFQQNQHDLDALVAKAEKPALFYAGVLAYRDAIAGRPSGYMINLDATASGFQVLACLTGDSKAATICNVVDTGNREDAYTSVYEEMLRTTGTAATVTRKQCKDAVMPSLYGSTAMPKQIFGEGDMLTAFEETMDDLAPAVWEFNGAMVEAWNPEAVQYGWTMADGFDVRMDVERLVEETVMIEGSPFKVSYKIKAPSDYGRGLGANLTHSVDALIAREMGRRCMFDPIQVERVRFILMHRQRRGESCDRKIDQLLISLWQAYERTGFLSARIIDAIDEKNVGLIDADVVLELIRSLPAKPFNIVMVHDCYRCLPNYGNAMRLQYNLLLEAIAKSNMLSDLVSSIMGRPITVQKHDEKLWTKVRNTNYALS